MAQVILPFDIGYITDLRFTLQLAVERGLRLRTRPGLKLSDIWQSDFFKAYTCALPSALDELQEGALGAAVREVLLESVFMTPRETALQLAREVFALVEDDAAGARDAWMLGAADGDKYFSSATDNPDQPATEFSNLVLAVRAMPSFSLG